MPLILSPSQEFELLHSFIIAPCEGRLRFRWKPERTLLHLFYIRDGQANRSPAPFCTETQVRRYKGAKPNHLSNKTRSSLAAASTGAHTHTAQGRASANISSSSSSSPPLIIKSTKFITELLPRWEFSLCSSFCLFIFLHCEAS